MIILSIQIVLLYLIENAEADNPITIIRDLIQNNLAGAPVIHEITKWDFDPDVAVKRRELFQEVSKKKMCCHWHEALFYHIFSLVCEGCV